MLLQDHVTHLYTHHSLYIDQHRPQGGADGEGNSQKAVVEIEEPQAHDELGTLIVRELVGNSRQYDEVRDDPNKEIKPQEGDDEDYLKHLVNHRHFWVFLK